MIKKQISYKYQIVLSLLSLFVLGSVYQGLSWRQRNINPKDTTMPSIVEIFTDGTKKIITPDAFDRIWIIEDSYASLSKLAIGLSSGVFLSCLIGTLMGCYPVIEHLFKWPITFFGQIPPTAMLAVYLVVYALLETPVVPMMICFGILPSLTLTIYNAAKYDVHEESVYKAYTLGASNTEVIIDIVVKQILPRVIDAIRICFGPALVYLIAAEWTNEHLGFGYRLKIQGRQTHMAVVYNYLAILAVFGYVVSWFLIKLRDFLSPWYGNNK